MGRQLAVTGFKAALFDADDTEPVEWGLKFFLTKPPLTTTPWLTYT